MSVSALVWAFDKELPCAQKLVLIALAEWSGGSDDEAVWRGSVFKLAAFAQLDLAQVQETLSGLRNADCFRSLDFVSEHEIRVVLNVSIGWPERRTSPRRERASYYVYVVSSGKGQKIGISARPNDRFKSLKSSVPVSMALLATWEVADRERAVQIERAAHDMLSQFRLKGEWFAVTESDALSAVRFAVKAATGFLYWERTY